jgi:RNase P/RNase MRP subunit p29
MHPRWKSYKNKMENTIRMPLLMKNTVIKNKKTGEKKQGKIIDESKNTFKIMFNDTIKIITKNNHTFIFNENGKQIEIDGKTIMRKPEDRIMIKSK